MRIRDGFINMALCLCVIGSIVVIGSCGGGSGDSEVVTESFPGFTPVQSGTMMTGNTENSQKAAALVMFSHSIGAIESADSYLPASAADASVGQPFVNAVLEIFRSELNAAPFQSNQTSYGSDDCPGGSGTMTVTMSWEGPEQPSSSNPEVFCNELSEVTMDITMSNCALDSTNSMTGSMFVQTSGQLCAPTSMTITMNNLSANMGANTMQTRQLTLDYSNITWDGSMFSGGTITSGISDLNGQAIGVMDGQQYAAAFDNYSETMTMVDDALIELSFSGLVTGPCLDGWTYIQTVAPVYYYGYATCPHAGELLLHCAGDEQIPIVFDADNGVSIGDSINYDSCEAMDGSCPW